MTDKISEIAQVSRIILINYFGNDGALGSLHLESEEHEEVSINLFCWLDLADGKLFSQGIKGAIRLKGSSQGLGEYTLRMEDSM